MTLKNVLKHFSKKSEDLGTNGSFAVAQDDGTHPCHLSQTILNRLFGRVLEREGEFNVPSLFKGRLGWVSYAKHTEKNLPSNRLIVLTTLKKAAFTLAEVLITLGIIGVVAAMTLPTLIQNHQKQAYVTGLKKALSVSSNMFKQMQADEEASDFASTELFSKGICKAKYYNNFDSWQTECGDAYGDISIFEKIIPKYLKVVKICSSLACDIKYRGALLTCNNNKCSANYSGTFSAAGEFMEFSAYAKLIGFYTSDGIIYYMLPMDNDGTVGINMYVDINGQKGPNTMGRDLFHFAVDSNGKLTDGSSILWSADPFTKHLMENGYNMDY